jgi:uncharacterized protein YpuA (DUF1002 family)
MRTSRLREKMEDTKKDLNNEMGDTKKYLSKEIADTKKDLRKYIADIKKGLHKEVADTKKGLHGEMDLRMEGTWQDRNNADPSRNHVARVQNVGNRSRSHHGLTSRAVFDGSSRPWRGLTNGHPARKSRT